MGKVSVRLLATYRWFGHVVSHGYRLRKAKREVLNYDQAFGGVVVSVYQRQVTALGEVCGPKMRGDFAG